MTQTEINIYEYTQKKLKAHQQNNQEFNFDLATIYEFYKIRLLQYVQQDKVENMENMLFAGIQSQIFNGYFMAMELMQNSESIFEDDWFKQAEGVIAQQIPDMLRIGSNNNLEEVITMDSLREMIKWMVIEYEGVYPTLMDISLNTACLGALWAFKDEANKRGIDFYKSQHKGLLASLDDITFINPQSYLSLAAVNNLSEVWEIINSDYRGLDKIGEVTILAVGNGDSEKNLFLNASIKSSLTDLERDNLLNQIVTRAIVMNTLDREKLTVSLAQVDGYFQYN
ncbi:hypothetical protein [Cytobacillus firmus]|uniref:hypothetical protein n=1 Tax=Cytobacillus firmus TaxID=1399 RepID=UPI003002B38C